MTTATTTAAKDPKGPQWYKVRSSFPVESKKVLFRSVSEKRARAFLEKRFPRGEEAYLEGPDGKTESYAAERVGEHGEDVPLWQAFDPDSWVPPAEQEPPGQSDWADVES